MEITRRDYFAAHAMKAVIDRIRSYEMAVEVAVKYADALIAELDKTAKPEPNKSDLQDVIELAQEIENAGYNTASHAWDYGEMKEPETRIEKMNRVLKEEQERDAECHKAEKK